MHDRIIEALAAAFSRRFADNASLALVQGIEKWIGQPGTEANLVGECIAFVSCHYDVEDIRKMS